MSEVQALLRVRDSLGNEKLSLNDIWLSHPSVWQSLGWQQAQLKLWLACQKGILVSEDSQDTYFSLEDRASKQAPDLIEEIFQIVQSHGKPLPIAQLRNKLPASLMATEPMLKEAINKHEGLVMMGPMVKAKN